MVPHAQYVDLFNAIEDDDVGIDEENGDEKDVDDDEEVFEVSEVLAICYGDPNGKKEQGLHFKVVEVCLLVFFSSCNTNCLNIFALCISM